MEEVQVIDCPPTPEILLPSSTPPSSSLLDMLDSSSSAEEVDTGCTTRTEEGTTESGRFSPPPKCAICLGKCRQKCYTDSCRHQFCYRCLLEWSKIKAECPLCKQVFRSIIYKQKMFDRYEEQIIGIVPPASPPLASSREGPGMGAAGMGSARAPQVYHRLDFTLSQSPRFTYSATLRVQPSQSERLQQLFLHQSGDVQRFSREYPDDSIPSRQNGPEWRRYIYHRRLHARPLPDINGRSRECSAAFYRENPAQIHRLMPWINRELISLCRGNPSQITLIMEDFPNLLMTHDITSPAFRERVSYWGRSRTIHFIHELLNFARSPYDMIGYDRSVQYDPYYNSVVVLSSSSSSSSGSSTSSVSEGSDGEDDVVRIVDPVPGTSRMVESSGGPSSGRRGRTQFTIETRSSDQTVIMTGSFGGAGVSGIVSVSTSGTQTNGNVGGSSTSAGFPDLSRMHPLTSLPAIPVNRLDDGANISLSSSDSDDCRIVGALKPPHLRTPEMVSLESESDSDVVFVNDVDNRREETVPMESVPLDQQFQENGFKQDVNAKIEERSTASVSDYNNGASTSSGGGGGGSSLAIVGGVCGGLKKFYAKPRLNRPTNGVGFKSIYEASESSEKSENSCSQGNTDSSNHADIKLDIRNPGSTSNRRRKAAKRRPTPADSSDQSSSSEAEVSAYSSSSFTSTNSSSSSESDSESDFKLRKTTRMTRKKRTCPTKLRKMSSASKRRQGKQKKRSKVKKQKSPPSRPSRKRSKMAPKLAKSATEHGTVESLPSESNTSPKPSPSSSTRKRKLRSAVVKPEIAGQVAPRKRRKVPICSELISSTDFSADEDPSVSAAASVSQPIATPSKAAKNPGLSSSSGDSSGDNATDSEEHCPIASLIAAAKRPSAELDKKSDRQNTSTASIGSSSSNSNSSSSSSSSNSSNSSTATFGSNECTVDTSISSARTAQSQQDLSDNQHSSQASDEEASATQLIAVGAEVEL